MRTFLAAWLVVVTGCFTAGCATTDLKGRERTRVGVLRGERVVPARVAKDPVRIDAGTNVLTDAELDALGAELPSLFERSVEKRQGEREARAIGEARVLGCRVDAGPGRAYTVYEARCRVALFVKDVALIEVHTQALRRVRSRAIGENEAKEIAKLERNPLLVVDDTRAALASALDAAAALIASDELPASDTARAAPARLAADERRALARVRYDKARVGDGNLRAALHDLAEAGSREDALLIAREMDAKAPALVLADEIDALALLCVPATRPSLDRLLTEPEPTPYRESVSRALAALAACNSISR